MADRRRAVRLLGLALGTTAVLLATTGRTVAAPSPVAAPAPVAPRGAPNILIVMTDDVGFGATAPFGGPIPTPTFAALASEGLRYNRFHTTAMCSPSRAALLTGRNHHAVGSGTITELASGDPGYTSILPPSAATIGQVLRGHGYDTAWFGKNHNTPEWEQTALGPFDRWPTGLGFDTYYGIFGGVGDPGAPALVEGTRLVDPPSGNGYLLDRDLVDRSVSWLRTQGETNPGRPFLLYIAPLTAHAPHRAPPEWIARFRGRFDQGWDRMREDSFARQREAGIVPADAVLTPRPAEIPAWDSLTPQRQRIAARLMEVYAAQLAYFDHQLGRVIDELRRSGRYDNTLILYVQGDNGASGEGGLDGTLTTTFEDGPPDQALMAARLADYGGPDTFENYPVGWAWAMNTPFQWTKQIASHLGGMRNGMVISWPARIRDHGGLRSQFAHLVDIAPTLYEAAGIAPPSVVAGVPQQPIDGTSLVYSFDRANAPSRHRTQYFEMLGNRAWYEDGWLAATRPGALPWRPGRPPAPEDYRWELYHLDTDYAQARNLAEAEPQRLAALQRNFAAHAAAQQVLPLRNDIGALLNSSLRPYVTSGRQRFEFNRSDVRIPDQSFPDLVRRSWTLTAEIVVRPGQDGALINQGGWFGGWGLFVRRGKPEFVYRRGIGAADLTVIAAPVPLAEGAHRLVVAVRADGPARGAGAAVTLSVDGRVVATGHIPRTVGISFKKEGVGIGRETGTGIRERTAVPDRFGGEIGAIRLMIDGDGPAPLN